MEEILHNISIKRFKSRFPDMPGAALGDDLLIADLRYDKALSVFKYPFRFDGYIIIFCISGRIQLEVNLDAFQVGSNSLVLNVPGNIIRVSGVETDERNLHFIVVAMSKSFMSGVRFDFNRLFNESMALLDNPCITLDRSERRLCREYLDLASVLLTSDIQNKKEAIGALISSISYVLGSIWTGKLTAAERKPHAPSAKAKNVYDQFLRLVTDYHTSERNMKFYADRLCLTPKYLSKLVKTVSGRSAPDWIDAFVILEAKNLLKYSDLSIKQIVAKLNFPNQSVFYKFFKSHTGKTPSQYRNE
ncbi:MAG: helix-turn-helix domain-containing protein [Candidatus Cryptobacteroides sp.]|nr:helix-turn-helix domain-containing protein [Bacteroidales bacterium]MDY3962860.1 helix-turn-helix domain-containing protein [Candidatus Cryptobacteroides sp.]